MELHISESAKKRAIERQAVEVGTVKFTKSTIKSPVVQKVAGLVAEVKGTSRESVLRDIEEKVAKEMESFKLSPALFDTIAANIYESKAFEQLEHIDDGPMGDIDDLLSMMDPSAARLVQAKKMLTPAYVVDGAPKFSSRVMGELVNAIRSEHKEFQRFEGMYRQKSPRNPSAEYVEDNFELTDDGIQETAPGISGITTACADPEGRFFYNKKFMQNLMNFAFLKGVKPKGKKYVCNGGTIPNEYCYAEFVVIHEFKHFTMDDFYYQEMIPNAKNKIINWCGDFRTNYDLVKAGYEQLPMGLFSDSINLDRFRNYSDMYNFVRDELAKLPKKANKGEGGEGGGEGGDAEDALDRNSNDDHEIGQKKGKEIIEKDKKQGKVNKKTVDDIDNLNKDNRNLESAEDAEPDPSFKPDSQEKRGSEKGSKGSEQVMVVKKQATYTWTELLKRLIAKACKPLIEDSYQKYNPKNITGALVAALTGAGYMKPGEMVEDERKPKLCFVVDASGSMSEKLELLYANILGLYHKHPMQAAYPFYLFKVVGDYKVYHCVFKTKKATEIDIHSRKKMADHDLMRVFTQAGGAEDFSKPLADHVIEMMDLGYNILLMSDCQITPDNFDQINRMFKHSPTQMFVIFGSQSDYMQYRDRLKGNHAHLSHM